MKALIITYYWPPSGGSGVQRWLKFVKYLRDFGIEPIVYTVKNPNYAIEDISLENEIPQGIAILKQPIWEPNDLLSFFKSSKQQTSAGFLNPNPSFFEQKLQAIRANYFIPDARKFWIKPSVKFLGKYLKHNKIDVIISTGPPHSVHLIANALQKKFAIKWIADFRDPWTDIDYFHQLPLSKKSKQIHYKLEKEVVQSADAILVVGKTMKENYRQFNKNIHVVSNGFDGDLSTNEINLDNKFTITHIGLMNADRNPKILWKVLGEICNESKEFRADLKINLVGKIANEVKISLQKNGLTSFVHFIDYVPHQEVKKHQNTSQLLLLVVNNVPSKKGIITGKIFEYLQANRPILAIGPEDGDLSEIIYETQSGKIFDYSEYFKLKEQLLFWYQQYKLNNLHITSINTEQYHRKNLTQELSIIIKNLF